MTVAERQPFRLPYIQNKPLKIFYSILWGIMWGALFTRYPFTEYSMETLIKAPIVVIGVTLTAALAYACYSK